MNRVESIELAKKLQDQFADLEKTEKDIKHYEEALEKGEKPLSGFKQPKKRLK